MSSFPGAGTVLDGRFKLREQVDRSPWGDVYLAADQLEALTCRVELIAASGRRGDEFETYARREVKLSDRLNRPGFLRALGWGRLSKTQLWVAREEPDDLRRLDLATGTLAERARRLLEISRRVEAMHEIGLVHRDLGPGALFQGGSGEVLLGRFRLTLAVDLEDPDPGTHGLPFAFPPGASPEVLVAPDAVDARADTYSLGVLLFEVLTGDPPFPGPTLFDIAAQHEAVRSERRPAPRASKRAREVPELLDNLCTRSLTLDAEERVPDAKAFSTLLQLWLDSLVQAEVAELESPSEELPVAPPVSSAPAGDEEPEPVELSPEEAAALLSSSDMSFQPAPSSTPDDEAEELSPEEAAALFGSPASSDSGSDDGVEELSPEEASALIPTSADQQISLGDVLPDLSAPVNTRPKGWDPFGSDEIEPGSGRSIHDTDTDRLPKQAEPIPAAAIAGDALDDATSTTDRLPIPELPHDGSATAAGLAAVPRTPPPTPTLAMPVVKPPPAKAPDESDGGPDLGALDLTDAPRGPVAAPPASAAAPPPSSPAPLPALPEDDEDLGDAVELLPHDAFASVSAYETTLVLVVRPKGFEVAVAEAKHLQTSGFRILLLDMSEVAHVTGVQLEALTEIVSIAARRDLDVAMFGLKADMQSLIKIMDMGEALPRMLKARTKPGALAEVG